MASRTSRPRMSGFYALFFLGNILSALLNLAIGNWIAAAANAVVATGMWWVHRL